MDGENKVKILFVFDHPHPEMWRDGLWRAMKELEKDFSITYRNLQNPGVDVDNFDDYNFVLGWGGFNSPVDNIMMAVETKAKKGLCIGGNVFTFHPGYDVLFYETEAVRKFLQLKGNCVHAFGVNTEIYQVKQGEKLFDFLGVGSFSSWKRWEKMKERMGIRMVIGEYQWNNETESMSIIRDMMEGGVMVSPMQNPEDLCNIYNMARNVYIPASLIGGGERAVLEARACGCRVEVENDNFKLQELLAGPIYDHLYYADQLKKGIKSVCE